jgi:hypothetical protein
MPNTNTPSRPSTAVWWIIGILALVLLVWLLFAWVEPMAGAQYRAANWGAEAPIALLQPFGASVQVDRFISPSVAATI